MLDIYYSFGANNPDQIDVSTA